MTFVERSDDEFWTGENNLEKMARSHLLKYFLREPVGATSTVRLDIHRKQNEYPQNKITTRMPIFTTPVFNT